MANALYQLYRQKALDPKPVLFVTDATNATPIVITTSTAHGLADADQIAILGVGGNTAANAISYADVLTGGGNIDADGNSIKFRLFSDSGLTTGVAGNGAYTSGGNVLLTDTLMKKQVDVVRWGVGSSGNAYGDDIKCAFVNVTGTSPGPADTYTVDLTTHEFLNDVWNATNPVTTTAAGQYTTNGAIVAISPVLVNKTTSTSGPFVGGTADADDVVFTTVGPSGTTVEAFVLFKDTGDPATASLIAYFDTPVTGLPFTANGASVTIAFDAGANRIFKL